jgi:hypothetical protein
MSSVMMGRMKLHVELHASVPVLVVAWRLLLVSRVGGKLTVTGAVSWVSHRDPQPASEAARSAGCRCQCARV